MVRAVSTTPIAVLIGPLCHVRRIDSFGCQAGYNDGHSGRPTGVTANGVCAVQFVLPAFVQLVVVDHLRLTIRENDSVIGKSQGREFGFTQALVNTIAQQNGEVLRILACQ